MFKKNVNKLNKMTNFVIMIYTLKTSQLLKSDIETVWDFMSSPENLALITPSYMGFTILSDKEDIKKMYPISEFQRDHRIVNK